MSLCFLIGMPGSGKTYWGRKLADKYSLGFTDLDEYIEQQEGRYIKEIFATDGESYFRMKEAECLRKLGGKDKLIIACGGGTPVYHDNMAWMKGQGCVVYIKADIQTLLDRVGTGDSRPMLNNEDIRKALENLYCERSKYYEQAHYSLQANESIIANFEQIVDLCTGQH